MTVRWYVAKVKQSNEALLQSFLRCHDVQTYVPEIVVFKRGTKRLEYLFPGYVFVQVSLLSDHWGLVRWAKGLKYFLPAQGQPEPIADLLVEELQNKVWLWNSQGCAALFEPGDPIRIEHGPLRTLDAIFRSYLPGNQRCEILLSLVGRQQNVRVPVADLHSLVANHRFADLKI